MDRFDLNNLEKTIDDNTRNHMLDVILAWARYDTFVSKWMSLAFGTSSDAIVILMGNMDTRNKLDKLKALYEHFDDREGATGIDTLSKDHKEHVGVRNAIAHIACVGRFRDDPAKIVFSSMKRVKGKVGYSLVETYRLEHMRAASTFALDSCDTITKVIEAMKGPLGPREPPLP